MTDRYYCPNLPSLGGQVFLSEPEAAHAIRVMRVQTGETITLFDGMGKQSEAVVSRVTRRDCVCDARASESVDRESITSLHLGVALPKPDRCRELVERLTEMGVRSFTPILANRSQRPPTTNLIDKLNRAVVEACKQSGRNRLMEIHEPMRSECLFTNAMFQKSVCWIAHPEVNDHCGIGSSSVEENQWVVAIGPEGGWDDHEVACAIDNGFSPMRLGERILRIETAAIVVAARIIK